MKLVCAPPGHKFRERKDTLNIVLYGQPSSQAKYEQGSAGQSVATRIRRARLAPHARAWDFLSIAMSAVVADHAASRSDSPDGWTREIDLTVAVTEPDRWAELAPQWEAALKFLSTDRWHLRFVKAKFLPAAPRKVEFPADSSVALLSGGLDSLVGAIDLATSGARPLVVSKIDVGDRNNQVDFARAIGGGLRHLALNHNASPPGPKETSQRARSIGFIGLGVAAAVSVARYRDGDTVPLYINENGFIAMNAPLTRLRLGSLSTRTAHPEFLARMQAILHAAEMRVALRTPYEATTKGEMLAQCADQAMLAKLASRSVSCGRYRRMGFMHCGRCVPCQVRRASFLRWGKNDATQYKYKKLGLQNADHAAFDDVRSVALAVRTVASEGLDRWLGGALNFPLVSHNAAFKDVVRRGLSELADLHDHLGVA
jgi:hypothetical protein